jgi:hypothetical protein
MAIILNADFDEAQLNAFLRSLNQFSTREINITRHRAILRTGTEMRTEAVRQIKRNYTVKSNQFRNTMKVKARVNDMYGYLKTTGKVLSMTDFKFSVSSRLTRERKLVKLKGGTLAMVRQRLWNIRSEIKKGESHQVTGGFMRKVAGRNKPQIFVKKDRKQQFMLGPSVVSMMNSERVMESVMNHGKDRLTINLVHHINRLITTGGV